MGDVADGFGDVNACCWLLVSRKLFVVRGNHERWLLRDEMRGLPDATPKEAVDPVSLAFLSSLPTTRRFDTVAGSLPLCHGLGESDMAGVRPYDDGYAIENNEELKALRRARDVDLVVCGHTHRRMVRAFPGVVVINAGTLLRVHQPCFGLVNLNASAVTFFEQGPEGGLVATVERLAVRRR